MTDESSSAGFSFLDPSTMINSPINKDGIKSVSTPLRKYDNNEKLSPIDLTEILESQIQTPISKDNNETDVTMSKPKRSGKRDLVSTLKDDFYEPKTDKPSELDSAWRDVDNSRMKETRVNFSSQKDSLFYRKDFEKDAHDLLNEGRSELRGGREANSDFKEVITSPSRSKKTRKKSHEDTESSRASSVSRLITDPNIPYVLSLYLQLFFNFLLISIVLYFVFIFIRTIRSDIKQKIEIYTTDALQEISMCTREYYRNKCSTEYGNQRAPALESSCVTWGKCMNRDPQLIGKSKITAETIADILNGFIRPISWKSLFFINFVVFGSLLITNMAFGSYRHSSRIEKGHSEEINEMKLQLAEQRTMIEKYHLLENRLDELDYATINTSFKRLSNVPDSTRTNRVHHSHDISSQVAPRSANGNLSFSSPLVNKRR